MPEVCQELGALSRSRSLDSHLTSKVHVECLRGHKFRMLSPPEIAITAPIYTAMTVANKNELLTAGNLMHTIYNDVKRGTLSADSWLSRHAVYKISEKFKLDSFKPVLPCKID